MYNFSNILKKETKNSVIFIQKQMIFASKYVFLFAGESECPFYALAELLGDQLATNLPDFKFYKIVKTSSEWKVR